jgi:hypothetical protein
MARIDADSSWQGIKTRSGYIELDTDNGSIKTRSGFVMAWYREENFTSQFQIRNGKSTY